MDLILDKEFLELSCEEIIELEGGVSSKEVGYCIGKGAGLILGTVHNVWSLYVNLA